MEKKKFYTHITEYLLLYLFAAITLFFFLGYLFIPQKDKSEWENRYLSKRPEINMEDIKDGSFMENFESYTNDQIVFRDGLIHLKALCEAAMFKITNNSVARGKEGYLFTEDTSQGEVFKKNCNIIKTFAEKSERDISIMIAPNACGIISDKLPAGIPVPDQKELISEFQKETSLLKNVRVIDLLRVLMNHKDEEIYYKTDHHWTSLAAAYAYEEFSGKKLDLSKMKAHEVQNFFGTLYAKYKGFLVKPDTIIYYDFPIKDAQFGKTESDTLYDLGKTEEFDKYGLFLHGNSGYSEINTESSENRSIIIFKDSYANCLIPFLTRDYSNIKVIDLRYYGDSVANLIEENKEAEILFIYNYDFLNEDNHFYKLMK